MLSNFRVFDNFDNKEMVAMSYKSLRKLFYTNNKEHMAMYSQRFHSPSAIHIDLDIKQFNHNNSFKAFYYYNEELVVLLERIYSQHSKLLTIIEDVPPLVLHQFGIYCIVDEVHSTSAIEGIHSTHRELQDILEGNSHSRHFSSILRKYDALVLNEQIDLNTCQDIRSLYDDFAYEDIVANNQNNKLDGKIFRAETVDVVNSSGKILHRGLSPEDKIVDAMNIALNILHDANTPILVRIAIFHYLFVYIHPFYDGNGRTARFISSYYLAKNFHYLSALRLSYIIKRHQRNYYDLIHNTELEINCGDLTPFIMGFCTIFLNSIDNVCSLLDHKAKQIHKYETKLLELFADDKLKLDICLTLLYTSAFIGQGKTMEALMHETGKSRNTIREKLISLPEGFIVTEHKKRKIFYKLNALIFKGF